ncbi:hypothetical protein LTR72_010237 [Exophiala xenobiotica]|nr:hypothetical protein LTR72_010237 [Exophiala xenobiotica]KAK5286929.1 hypothetical protein LTR14_009674 [Exophiala xenobiotica]KAK5478134.1 hypothetical protein LTR55_008118 [Exophiala xenobiotica]
MPTAVDRALQSRALSQPHQYGTGGEATCSLQRAIPRVRNLEPDTKMTRAELLERVKANMKAKKTES